MNYTTLPPYHALLFTRQPELKTGFKGRKPRKELKKALKTGEELTGYDLSKLNLAYEHNLNKNLSYVNLSRANLKNACLCNANLRGANLTRANLKNANLCGADLRGADLTGTNIEDAKSDCLKVPHPILGDLLLVPTVHGWEVRAEQLTADYQRFIEEVDDYYPVSTPGSFKKQAEELINQPTHSNIIQQLRKIWGEN